MAKTCEEGWCIVQMTVLPREASFLRLVTTLSAMNESRPDVGSSQNNKDGFVRAWQAKAYCIQLCTFTQTWTMSSQPCISIRYEITAVYNVRLKSDNSTEK